MMVLAAFVLQISTTINFCDHRRSLACCSKISVTRGKPPGCQKHHRCHAASRRARSRADVITFLDHDHGVPGGTAPELWFLPAGVFNNDLWMEITLVINDHHPYVPTGFSFDTHRFTFNDVFEHLMELGKNRNEYGLYHTGQTLFHLLAS